MACIRRLYSHPVQIDLYFNFRKLTVSGRLHRTGGEPPVSLVTLFTHVSGIHIILSFAHN